MAIATPEVYVEMLSHTKEGKLAYPTISVTSSQTLTAALQGLTEAQSDGIIQISVGGAGCASGSTAKDRVAGSFVLAAHARKVARNYPVTVTFHTDYCTKQNIDSWVHPLLELETEEVKANRLPFFQSHMRDGSAVPLVESLETAKGLLALLQAANTTLGTEVGVVGGEEDGVVGKTNRKLYTITEDALATVEALDLGENGRYLTALTFDNVHGVYEPGHVKLRPGILGTIQEEVATKVGWKNNRPLDLIMHGGSGFAADEITLAVANDVIKTNVDTNTQCTFTRPATEHMFRKHDGVLKVDDEVGNKKGYDPRSWGELAEASTAVRMLEACDRLDSIGTKVN